MRHSLLPLLALLMIQSEAVPGAIHQWDADPRSDQRDDVPPGCSVREISRRELQIEGSLFAYFEPEILLESEGTVLLGGFPNYTAVSVDGGTGFRYRRNESIGVVLEGGGGVRTVPIPSRLQGRAFLAIRGASLGEGRWAMILSVLPEGDHFPDQQEPDEIWFGIYGPAGWDTLERQPLEQDWHAAPRQSSRMVVVGDTLAWALPFITQENTRGIKLLTRAKGRSRLQDLPVSGVSGVDLFPHTERGLLVAVTGLRRDEPSEVVEVLSQSGSEWFSARVSEADGTYLSDPFFSHKGASVAWMSAPYPFSFHDSQLRAGKSLTVDGEGPLVLDGPTGGIIPLHLDTPYPTWISAQPFDSIRGGYMRFVGLTGEDQFLLDTIPNPFGAVFQGVATENGHILLAGPDMWKVTRGEGLATLFLELEIVCPDPDTQVPH